jgi:mono/diheme cytochrome c family protein
MGNLHRIGLALGLLALVLLAAACAPAQSGPVAPGDATNGGNLWFQSACVGCHGLNAEGSELGPALAHTPLTLHEVTSITRRGGPGMPKYPASQISDADLQDLYAWWQNPVPPAAAVPGQDPWTLANCAGCHGRDGRGGSGPGLVGTSWPFAQFQAVVRGGAHGMPAYSEAQVSDQTLQAMYDWLQAQAQGPAPTAAAAPERDPWSTWACAGCHGRDGRGGSGPGLVGTAWPFAQFQAVVRGGARGMPAFSEAQISDETLQAMYDWLQAQAEGPAPAAQPAPWVQAGCGACHGANAEGATATRLTGEDLSYDEFQRVVRGGEEGMPAYSASQVSDADLRQMYDWLMALP